MADDESPPMTLEARRRAWWIIALVLGFFVVVDILVFTDLFRHGSAEDLDHAHERLTDPLTGPNAP